MAARPYWTGQIRISLVSFPVTLVSALRQSRQIKLHEIDRETGERIRHRNVNEGGEEVDRENIIKAYDTGDGIVTLEPQEIADIKLPSSDTLKLDTFVKIGDIPLSMFERPYFVLPDGKAAEEIYAVIHKALLSSGKAGIGQITLRGREELCAVIPVKKGLMLNTLRYQDEVVDEEDILPDLTIKLKSDYVALAHQLIEKNTVVPGFEKFHDHYHEAFLELIDAKKAHRKPVYAKATKPGAKVVDFMDALRKSLETEGVKSKRSPARHRRTA